MAISSVIVTIEVSFCSNTHIRVSLCSLCAAYVI